MCQVTFGQISVYKTAAFCFTSLENDVHLQIQVHGENTTETETDSRTTKPKYLYNNSMNTYVTNQYLHYNSYYLYNNSYEILIFAL